MVWSNEHLLLEKHGGTGSSNTLNQKTSPGKSKLKNKRGETKNNYEI